ncbi:hypothetical protein [Bradyrhizobium sp.]
MLRNLFVGLGRALRGTLYFCWGAFDFALSLPFRLLAGAGAAPSPPIAMPVIKDSKPTGLTPSDVVQSLLRESRIVYTYAGACLLARERQPTPEKLSSAVKAWLPGLTVGELQKLTCVGSTGICEHLQGTKHIAGLPRVQPLPARALTFEPKGADPEDGLAMLTRELGNIAPGLG